MSSQNSLSYRAIKAWLALSLLGSYFRYLTDVQPGMPWTADATAHVALLFMVSNAVAPHSPCVKALGGKGVLHFRMFYFIIGVGGSTCCHQSRSCAHHTGVTITFPPPRDGSYAHAVVPRFLRLTICRCTCGGKQDHVRASCNCDGCIPFCRKLGRICPVVRPSPPTSRRYRFMLQKIQYL